MADIFISYKTEDRARVALLVDALTAEGLSVWWDVHIEGGVVWRERIERELEGAACVIVVWSLGSVGAQGHFVQDEAARGQRRGVCLQVAIDPVEPPLGFGQHQALSLIGWRGARRDPRFVDVLAAARAMIAREPLPRRAAAVPRTGRRIGFRIGLAAAAAAVVAGAAAWLLQGRIPGLGPSAPANSLAVLPFANLSGDPTQDYFSDGLSEELISVLARLNPLRVTARTSSFRFKGSHEDSAAIGAKLGVAWLLDGSVRRDGGLVRVSAELADAKSGYERWSATYDRDLKDIFAVQSGIAQAVAEALKVQLFGSDVAALSQNGTSSPEAYDAYLRGRRLLLEGAGEAGYREALARFDGAIAADPRYAGAYAARAITLVYLANQFVAPEHLKATYAMALASARQAVELAPGLASAQKTLASTLIYANHDFAGAKPIFARAEALGGGDANVLHDYGLYTCEIGDCVSGAASLRRAASLDPLNPFTFKILAATLLAARQYPQAIAAMRRTLALSPRMEGAHGLIGDALTLEGAFREALAEYALEPSTWTRQAGQAIALWRLGDPIGARGALKALIANGGDANAYQEAQIYAQWGDRDRAFAALDKAIDLGDGGLLLLKVDPLLDGLRGDPRFAQRLARMGLNG